MKLQQCERISRKKNKEFNFKFKNFAVVTRFGFSVSGFGFLLFCFGYVIC